MRLDMEHRFRAPLEAVESAMVDASYLESLRLPDVAPPTVLGVDEHDDGQVTARVLFKYTGSLDGMARRVLRDAELGWVQEVTLDRATHRATFTVIPTVAESRLSCDGTYALSEADGATVRVIRGHLTVHVPLVAARAERMIGPGVKRRLTLEAQCLESWLERNAG